MATILDCGMSMSNFDASNIHKLINQTSLEVHVQTYVTKEGTQNPLKLDTQSILENRITKCKICSIFNSKFKICTYTIINVLGYLEGSKLQIC